MFYPKKFPRFLPNLSLMDPDGFLVADLESYKAILSVYADYTQQLDAMLEPWNELAEMLEMWQRTCGKANPNLTVKGPIPDIKPQQLTRSGHRISYSYNISGAGGETPISSSSPSSGSGFSASALLAPTSSAPTPVPNASQLGSPPLSSTPTQSQSYLSQTPTSQQLPVTPSHASHFEPNIP